ncbi:9392_t:CDS:2 [Cetraspora pellucida]|uniref:9392_t:CDS:1 n=1 Tax=Cetraspora pellucida TaxID=1433469 RepID=A0A9N9ENQ2_9GLOM|nr:9392_t:CDS:2 [Cetraspora pellucida]
MSLVIFTQNEVPFTFSILYSIMHFVLKYTKGSNLYQRPSGSVSDPFPTPFEENYKGDIKFLVIGDWGQKGPGTGQTPVADAMKTWADKNHTTFVLNL